MKAEFRRCARAAIPRTHRRGRVEVHLSALCHQLVPRMQACEPIPAIFLLAVPARNRQASFWRHSLLVPKGGHWRPITPDLKLRATDTNVRRQDHHPAHSDDEDLDDYDEDDDEGLTNNINPALLCDRLYINSRRRLLWTITHTSGTPSSSISSTLVHAALHNSQRIFRTSRLAQIQLVKICSR
jgi:hypothetical protein